MGFSNKVADEVLVKCSRHCCICGKFTHKMQLHHIKAFADGGDDTIDNCIPLCPDCHANVKADNPKHSLGRKYTENELKGHRDKCYAKYGAVIEPSINDKSNEIILNWVNNLIEPKKNNLIWGYSTLDKWCPFIRGTITLIAGYSLSGKSIYAQHIARKNLLQKQRIVYFNLKDSDGDILNNILASEAMVDLGKIQNDLLAEKEWQRVYYALNHLNIENLKLISKNSVEQIDEGILSVVQNKDTDIVIIDDFDGLTLAEDKIESFMYRLKTTVNTVGVSVIILSNLPNKVKRIDKRPLLSDFKSDSIYRFCDYIHFVHKNEKDEDYFDADVEIIVAKAKGINNTMIINAKYILNTPEFVEYLPCEENE